MAHVLRKKYALTFLKIPHKDNCMSAPPFNCKVGGNRYKYNYTLTGVNIKKISDNFVALWVKNLL
jgi:hypothetical protein